jgi:hypothetical protein
MAIQYLVLVGEQAIANVEPPFRAEFRAKARLYNLYNPRPPSALMERRYKWRGPDHIGMNSPGVTKRCKPTMRSHCTSKQ